MPQSTGALVLRGSQGLLYSLQPRLEYVSCRVSSRSDIRGEISATPKLDAADDIGKSKGLPAEPALF